jgi:glycosyltransferase involved in cell wall biosynthesis
MMGLSETKGVAQSGTSYVTHGDDHSSDLHSFKGQRQIAVVIPAFNEEITIGTVVLSARKYCDQVYIVNDGSVDMTSDVAKLAGATVLEMEQNSGKAAALMRGLRAAKQDGYSFIVMMDGDAQHKASDIPALVEPVLKRSADMVIGSRFLKEDNRIPAYRQAGQKVLNTFTNMGSGGNLTDTQSGFRALGPMALNCLNFDSAGYSVESDMITHFSNCGLNIVEVPVSVEYDVPNGHKQGSTSMGLRLFENVITTVAYKRPLILFGVPGLTLFILGLGLGSLSFFGINIFQTWLYQLVVSVSLITVGVIMIMFGLMQNSLAMLLRMNGNGEK